MAECFSFTAEARHKVRLEAPTQTTDAYGGQTSAYELVMEMWAILKPASGREVFAQQAQQNRVTHTAVVRYSSELRNIKNLNRHRIVYEGRYFGVNYLMNLHRDMKNEGKDYQKIYLEENGADTDA